MNLPLLFARRYLLSKRSTNAINVITWISIVVIAVVTGAMVVVMSAMNGIAELVDKIYSPFDQDITITAKEGKTFAKSTIDLNAILGRPGVEQASWSIEENVLLRCGDQQAVATLKGVEPQYIGMAGMAPYIFTGKAVLEGPTGPTAILGLALKADLGVPLDDGVFQPLEISAPIRGRKLSKYKQAAFEQAAVAMSGAFSMNMEYDSKFAVVPIDLAAELLHYDSSVSALELKLGPKANMDRTAKELSASLGDAFTVKTRYQKNALMYQTNATEKLVAFVVLAFIGLIGAFNVIASLTMMMIEKKEDMRTLMSMGAQASTVRRIFLHEGLLIVFTGALIGLALGIGICLAQQHFKLVEMAEAMTDSFPVKLVWTDLLVISATVLTIGLLATWVPLRALSRRFLYATAARA
ncbi:MAG TPA: FtsX-like permease family protein [Flavobacteriales bacterium]|nr:FtsX-like permease family protein [Flavobacteriales bacterium]